MCQVCSGNAPLIGKATGIYEPEAIYFGPNAVYKAYMKGTIYEGQDVNPFAVLDENILKILAEDVEKMKQLGANAYVPSSEEPGFFSFKFCPECGKKLLGDENESRP